MDLSLIHIYNTLQRMVDREAKRAEGKGVGYDRVAAVHNLKQMAATVAAMEQYGFTPDELDAALVSANADLHSSTAKLKPIETCLLYTSGSVAADDMVPMAVR